jgi:alanine transaminase
LIFEKMSVRIDHGTISAAVKAASYAVRGPIVARSAEISKLLKKPNHGFKFDTVISCNIGNPHALQQKSLTFIRDVLSIVVNPSLLQRADFPADVKERAIKYLNAVPDLGAYSESQGVFTVREEVAAFLTERDGYAANPDDIFLTNGASEGVRVCLQTIMRPNAKDGVLTPIPQYPLYSALITLLEGDLVPYYLDESNEWACTVDNLKISLEQAKAKGINTRALVVINPGNPTGQILNEDSMKAIVTWCKEEGIALMADEVYQENIWKNGAKFVSFRKVAKDMDAFSGPTPLQLISFHSVSKGFLGECGFRGGYFELLGIPNDVKQEILKLCSISLCSNTVGQIATGLMVQPPRTNDPSFALYYAEKHEILSSLRRRAENLSKALNNLKGVTCNSIDGAMYAFPMITLPRK